MRIGALAFMLASPPFAALGQEQLEPLPTRYVCVEVKPVDPADMPRSSLAMLEYVDRQLRLARVLEFRGEAAEFSGSLPGTPPLKVLARYNDMSMLERGYLMDGGPNCDAWQATHPPGSCDWRVREVTPEDQSSGSIRLVWQFLVLKGSNLTVTNAFSGQLENRVDEYDCTDRNPPFGYFQP